MAKKMILFWISLVLTIIGSNAAGELSIVHSPESLKFSGSSSILESLIKDVFSASLGMSVGENSNWKGLTVNDPFNTPEAVVEVYVDGVPSIGHVGKHSQFYPVIVDEYEPDTCDALSHRIHQRFSNGGANKVVNLKLSDPQQVNSYEHIFGPIKVGKVVKQSWQYLKYTTEEDRQFLEELEVLKEITRKVNAGAIRADNAVDFFNFRVTTLHALSDYHGSNSLQTKEAKHLLDEAVQELSDAFVKAYDGAVVVAVVSTDVAHTRRAPRSISEKQQAEQDINLAASYSAEYPVIFNILLWFGVVFTFTLIAIVYVFIDMDPGRDSIIYRMTSTRMKKDN